MHYCDKHSHFYYKKCRHCANEVIKEPKQTTCKDCIFYEVDGCRNSNWAGRVHSQSDPQCVVSGRLVSYQSKND